MISQKRIEAYRLLEQRRVNLVESFDPNNIIGFLESMAGLLALH